MNAYHIIIILVVLLLSYLFYRHASFKHATIIPLTWKTNWREGLALLVIGGGTLLVNAHLDYIGGWFGDPAKFAYLSNFLLGFAKWSGANFCGVLALTLWPSFNKFSNSDFLLAWQQATSSLRLTVWVAFYLTQVVVGAVCFSGQ